MTEVVPVIVHHELGQDSLDFAQEEGDDLGVGVVQEALEEFTPGLVDSQFHDVALESF